MKPDTIARLKENTHRDPMARKRLRRAGILFFVLWPMHPDHIPAPRLRSKDEPFGNYRGHTRTRRLKALSLLGQRHRITDDKLIELVAKHNKGRPMAECIQ